MPHAEPARTHLRPSCPAAIPCIRVEGASELLTFLTDAFDAKIEDAQYDSSGPLTNALVRIGQEAAVEVSEPNERFGPMPAAIHLYVPDVDELHQAALGRGGRELYAPAQMPYGERSSGIEDPCGNHWYLATYTGKE